MTVAREFDHYFRVPLDTRDLNYETFFDKGDKEITSHEDYNSNNAEQLNVSSVLNILKEDINLKHLFL